MKTKAMFYRKKLDWNLPPFTSSTMNMESPLSPSRYTTSPFLYILGLTLVWRRIIALASAKVLAFHLNLSANFVSFEFSMYLCDGRKRAQNVRNQMKSKWIALSPTVFLTFQSLIDWFLLDPQELHIWLKKTACYLLQEDYLRQRSHRV